MGQKNEILPGERGFGDGTNILALLRVKALDPTLVPHDMAERRDGRPNDFLQSYGVNKVWKGILEAEFFF